jgi:hypothetical protein
LIQAHQELVGAKETAVRLLAIVSLSRAVTDLCKPCEQRTEITADLVVPFLPVLRAFLNGARFTS